MATSREQFERFRDLVADDVKELRSNYRSLADKDEYCLLFDSFDDFVRVLPTHEARENALRQIARTYDALERAREWAEANLPNCLHPLDIKPPEEL